MLVTGACSAGSDKQADTKSAPGSASSTSAGAPNAGPDDSPEPASDGDDAQVLGTVTGRVRAGPNGEDTLVPLRLDVTQVKRISGNTVQVRLTLTNTDDTTTFEPFKLFSDDLYTQNVGRIALLDRPGDKKYLTLYDTEDECLCSDVSDMTLAPGDSSSVLYADVTAPPTSVDTVALSLEGFAPIEDLEIR